MEDNFFDIIIECSMSERLDSIILQSSEYKEANKGVKEAIKNMKKYSFSREEELVIDRLIGAYVSQSAAYGSAAYQQGFRDCASLLKEINLVEENIYK